MLNHAAALTLLSMLVLLPLGTCASKATLSGSDEQELQSGKRLCTYENSIYLFALVTRSQNGPFSKTFYISDNEK